MPEKRPEASAGVEGKIDTASFCMQKSRKFEKRYTGSDRKEIFL